MPVNVDYAKHLVECNCVLPQLKHLTPLIFHRFVVFSVVGEDGNVIPSYAQCPNCGIVHRIMEVGKSVIMRREDLNSLLTEDEIAKYLPPSLADVLRQYKVDYASWQQAKFIMENELWGRRITLSREELEGTVMGKVLVIIGTTLWTVERYEKQSEEVG